jgi:voltage-dependent calcium channel L type alpha-1D
MSGGRPVPEARKYLCLYFFAFVIVGSFLCVNLFVCVVLDKFKRLKAEYDGALFMTQAQQHW